MQLITKQRIPKGGINVDSDVTDIGFDLGTQTNDQRIYVEFEDDSESDGPEVPDNLQP